MNELAEINGVCYNAATSHMLSLPELALYSEYCWLGEACTTESIDAMARFVTGMTGELAQASLFCGAMR